MANAYLDTSALVKLAIEEPESSALKDRVARLDSLISCSLVRTEIPRALRNAMREHDRARRVAGELLASIRVLALSDEMLNHAGMLEPPLARSLDAIHVAAALTVRDLIETVITYDTRMTEAAKSAGLPVEAPA